MGSFDTRIEDLKLHAVCVPFPSQGHINPMLKLAKLLHSKGFHITFVNTEFNHNRYLWSRGPNSLNGLGTFRFESIPDGLPPSDPNATQDVPSLFNAVLNNYLEPFKKLLLKLNDPSSGSPPVSVIISDCIMPFTFDAARELGDLPLVLLWPSSACAFLGILQNQTLLDKGIVPFKDPNFVENGCLDMTVDWVPSMKGLRLKDLPSFIRTTDKEDIFFKFVFISIERCCASSAPIIFNTFNELEHEVLNDISKQLVGPMYNIGPLHFQLQNINQQHKNNDNQVDSLSSNLWKEDSRCLQWLDSMKSNSVVYVSFGSVITMTNEKLVEFAWGLANSNYPFLWIIRPDIVSVESPVLPPEFFEEIKDRGMLSSWCDQEKVLAHKATGVFLTHCGWNSSLDTICGGVPVICWPFFADQQTNCWFLCNNWGIGVEINQDVKRAEVEKQVREVMNGEMGKEMRKNAVKLKRLAEEAMKPTGSSYLNLEELIKHVFVPLK